MLWDGQSVGTLMNVFRLLMLNKKAVVYAVPKNEFIEFHNVADWEIFINRCDSRLRRKVEERATLDEPAKGTAPPQNSLLDQDHRPSRDLGSRE